MIDTHVLNRGGAACTALLIDLEWNLKGMSSRRNRLTQCAVVARVQTP